MRIPPHGLIALAAPFLDYLLQLQGALMLLTVLGYAAYRLWRALARPSPASPPAVTAPRARPAARGNGPRSRT